MTPDTPTLPTPTPEVLDRYRVPNATYRLQFHADFPFDAAREILPYLAELGVSDVYASPIFQARAGSTHGYDVAAHDRINSELGGEEAFERFSAALRENGLGLVLDVVPNHMGINDPANVWWLDVLENGQASVYANYFDIDWHPIPRDLDNRVLLPILEDQYGKVLEEGKLRLALEEGAFVLYYWSLRLPVAPRTYAPILQLRLPDLVEKLGPDDPNVQELESILTAVGHLPDRTDLAPERMAERNREKEVIKRRIAALVQASPEVKAALDAAVADFNGTPGDPRSFDRLDELINQQVYRPAFWRVAADEINYRRFFDINELAAIRVELPEVFEATHHRAMTLLAEGKASGLRIDHPDGLWNPAQYFRQLQEAYVRQKALAARGGGDGPTPPLLIDWISAAGAAAAGEPAWPLYVVAEKILAPGEPLPSDWAVAGTTGYDFLALVNGLFVERKNRTTFDKIYQHFTGIPPDYAGIEDEAKRTITVAAMASEINALAQQLDRLTEKNRRYRDFTLYGLRFGIREVIATLPVYRTYVIGSGPVSPRDAAYVEEAVGAAKRRNPRTWRSLFDFLRDTLLLRNLDDFDEADRPAVIHFVMKFQQVTGPVTAKGVEDTAFYRYYRLASLNEVGGNPDVFGTTLPTFHRENAARRLRWPHSLLATSTPDNTRSEDVRARINVLSELPEEWRADLDRWGRLNAPHRGNASGTPAPDRNDEYLFYQSVLGAWPADLPPLAEAGPGTAEKFAEFRERIQAYMQKAGREAKVHTSWVNPNEEYEAGVRQFVERTLVAVERALAAPDAPFVQSIGPLLRRVAFAGYFNGLAQTLLKLTSPGVPDLYQGTEMWDFSLVDPDNRRPVDYARRREALAELKRRLASGEDRANLARELVASAADGRVKLFVTHLALGFRRAHPELFSAGSYHLLQTVGRRRKHACAFARQREEEAALVVVPRLVAGLVGAGEQIPVGQKVWRDCWLVLPRESAGRRYRDVFTGRELTVRESEGVVGLPVAEACAVFPVALLERLPPG